MTRVYIAASSDEINRAERWSAWLRVRGADVVSTWPACVRAVGAANPHDASRGQRRSWSGGCLLEVATCDVLWLLVPAVGHGRGAYAELGAAHALNKRLVASGDVLQSVFTAQAEEFHTDAEAAMAIIGEPHYRHLVEMRTGGVDGR